MSNPFADDIEEVDKSKCNDQLHSTTTASTEVRASSKPVSDAVESSKISSQASSIKSVNNEGIDLVNMFKSVLNCDISMKIFIDKEYLSLISNAELHGRALVIENARRGSQRSRSPSPMRKASEQQTAETLFSSMERNMRTLVFHMFPVTNKIKIHRANNNFLIFCIINDTDLTNTLVILREIETSFLSYVLKL
jgi:hypothetical protein